MRDRKKDEVDEKKPEQNKAPEENISEIVKSSGGGTQLASGYSICISGDPADCSYFLVAAIFVNLRRKKD